MLVSRFRFSPFSSTYFDRNIIFQQQGVFKNTNVTEQTDKE